MHREKSQAVLVSVTLLILTSLGSGQQSAPRKLAEPKITAVRFSSFPPSKPDSSVEAQLEIDGQNLPLKKDGVTVLFDFKDPAHPFTCVPNPCEPIADDPDGKEIVVKGTAKAGTEVTRIRIVQNGKIVADTKKDFTISIKENPPKPKLNQFDIKLEPETNKEFPNLHSLVVTKEGGEADVGFADNPHWMTVDLMPSGASDVNIVQTSRERLDLHFVAAADYKPTSVEVTVYDGSDLDCRKVNSIAVSKKTPEDPDQAKVTGTETVFINRSHGVGRIRILGSGFGDYTVPPYHVDDYLWNCLEEFHIRGTEKSALWVQKAELEDLDARLEACAVTLKDEVNCDVKAQVDAALTEVKNDIKCEEAHQQDCDKDRDARYPKKELEYTKTNLAAYMQKKEGSIDPEAWAKKVRDGGWPSFPRFPFPFRNRGCPILAFFARVGSDAAWTILCVICARPGAGGPPFVMFVCTIPTEGAPSLRSLQGWAAMLPAQFCVICARPGPQLVPRRVRDPLV